MPVMTTIVLAFSLVVGALLPAVDLSGTWTGGPLYVVLRQDGDKLTGTGGPDKNEQWPFTGKIDGDHVALHMGKFELELHVDSSGELDGTFRMPAEGRDPERTMPVHLKRLDPNASAASAPATFEVASIKLNTSGDRSSRTSGRPGMLVMTNVPLKAIIEQAYQVKDFSLSGPDWLDTVRFDIEAQLPAQGSREEMRNMLQALLVDRFKLASHRETKTLSAYALVVVKTGAKLKEVEPGPGSTTGGRGSVTSTRTSMRQFADWLSTRMDHPVQDQTGLKGAYDIKLEWSPIEENAAANPDAAPPPDNAGPTIFTALQEQLGLRLQAEKLPVEILVIDHIERTPTEN